MAGNTIGRVFRLTTFGESHGPATGGVIDGCPAGLAFNPELANEMLRRRRPGSAKGLSPRDEPDSVEWLSGIHDNTTTGAPIAFMVRNKDARPEDYSNLKDIFRPSHADLSYHLKYGIRDYRGGGRSSARETLARVAGGAVAMMLLQEAGIRIRAAAISIGSFEIAYPDWIGLLESPVENSLHYADGGNWEKVRDYLLQLQEDGDSTGGIVGCVATGMPPGLGEPVFHKLNADLAAAMISIPASKGIEFGSGFRASSRRGSEENDPYLNDGERISTKYNRAGGIQGGISNGDDLVFSLAFKPASSIAKHQETVDSEGNATGLDISGRHDPCVVPRAVPVVEAMTALVLADHLLLSRLARVR